MMPGVGVVRGVPTQRNLGEQIERQMGCMTGILQLFDPHQILAGKRFYSAKRLSSSLGTGSTSPSEISEISTNSLVNEASAFPISTSPDSCPSSPENRPLINSTGCHTLPLPLFDPNDGHKSSWKLRESPRYSLDSRAVVDAKGKLRSREIQFTPMVFSGSLSDASENGEKQRRSPSVVARLMGLEALPAEDPPKRPELRRSSSESRVTRDLSHFNLHKSSPTPPEDVFGTQKQCYSKMTYRDKKLEASRPQPSSLQRKSFFDAEEFFPEPKRVGSLYGEIEKKLRMRGIEEPAKDLDTLKQILEALQLKGLLHSKQPDHHDGVRPRSSAACQAPIVVMKPVPNPRPRLVRSEPPTLSSSSMYRHQLLQPESIHSSSTRRDQLEIDRIIHNPGRQRPRSPEPSLASKNPSRSTARRRLLLAGGQRAPLPQRQIHSIHSPNPSPRRLVSGQIGQLKNQRSTAYIHRKDNVDSAAEDDTSSSSPLDPMIISSASQLKFEKARNENYSSDRSLLERCDKLLHSIAAISSSAEQVILTDRQPSPVSVLDSSFFSDESFASPLPKREIDFNDQLTVWNVEDGNNQRTSTAGSNSSPRSHEPDTTPVQHEDYAYVAVVLRESDLHGNDVDAFATIEKRHRTTISSQLHRRLVFDTVTELVNRKRHLSNWDIFSGAIYTGNAASLMREVWEELCRIQERIPATDVMEATCSVIRKDMVAGQGWGLSGAEVSEAVLHIERQVFKDLVGDTIRELADLTGTCRRTSALFRRKLVF